MRRDGVGFSRILEDIYQLCCTCACIGGRLVACVLSAHRENGGVNAVFPVRLGHEC